MLSFASNYSLQDCLGFQVSPNFNHQSIDFKVQNKRHEQSYDGELEKNLQMFYCNINPISQCFSIINTSITFFDIRSLPPYSSRYIAVPKLYSLYTKRQKNKPDFLSTIWSQCQRGRSATPPSPHTYTLAALTLGRLLLLLLLPPPCAAPARFYQAWPVLFQAHINTFHLDSRPHSVTV